MKHLKSSLNDLRRLFTHSIMLREIAEPLVSFDRQHNAAEVRDFMLLRDFDVVGIREHGVVTGYVSREQLVGQTAGELAAAFDASEVLRDTEPLLSVFEALRERRRVFVAMLGRVGGIITRGDLQKAPVRLWLFGLVSLLEMQLLRAIRMRYPQDAWAPILPEERANGVRRLFDERRRRNEESDLLDCLQLADKAVLLKKDDLLFELSGFSSRRALDAFFSEVSALRNALAHANDIVSGRWPALADMVATLESLLARLELTVVPAEPPDFALAS